MEKDQLYKIRHSLAHLLAIAVLEHVCPLTKIAIGPVIDDGFYYDFEFPEGVSVSQEDLKKIQKSIKKMIGRKIDFQKLSISEDEAKEIFKNQPYKLELIDEIIKKNKELSIYKTGDFTDLCEGPHISNTKELPADSFKITKLAGAYWRGDEKNKMLTRIYGVAFETKEELDQYLKMQEEAKKRDHRKLGKELDLFTFSDLIGAGLPLFTPKGTLMRDLITEKIQNIQKEFGYQKITIPHITKKDLYETSGHWEKFGDELFKVKGKQNTEFVMKPMNCPHHTQIFASQKRSYKELPIRYTESTMVYRDEQAGELLGLSRVRSITQDDGHAFCTIDQVKDEVKNITSVIRDFYTSLNMFEDGNYWVSLSVRDPKEDKYLGDEKNWEKAEQMLEEAAKSENLNYKKIEGEAAFYGPKLDFMFKDALGREWQLATIQLDFVMPERFKLEYTDKDGKQKTPVMIHRAIAGSLERFMAVLIEHFAGAFPVWLSPVQVKILSVSDPHKEYAKKIYEILKENNIRAELDSTDDSLGKRIRQGKIDKIPFILVLGDEEIKTETVMVESRDEGKLGPHNIENFIKKIGK